MAAASYVRAVAFALPLHAVVEAVVRTAIAELVFAVTVALAVGHAVVAQVALLAIIVVAAVIALVPIAMGAVALALRNNIAHPRICIVIAPGILTRSCVDSDGGEGGEEEEGRLHCGGEGM